MKSLTIAYLKSDGRNHEGRKTSFHRGGGFSKRYRRIDFAHMLKGLMAYVLKREYDPFRKTPIFLIYYENGFFSYHLGIYGVFQNMILWSGEGMPLWQGNSLPLYRLPIGSFLCNLVSKYARSAGSKCQLLKQYENRVLVKLPSGEEKFFPSYVWATVGRIARLSVRFEKKMKAGSKVRLGVRPRVRGVAMNPVDHPHGGGEGKTSGGRPSVSRWGKLTKGKKTRRR